MYLFALSGETIKSDNTISVIPFEFSPSFQFFPYPTGIAMALLKNAVSIEESQRNVKKVNILLAILTTSKALLSTCLCTLVHKDIEEQAE